MARASLKGSEALDQGIVIALQQGICPPALALAIERRTEACCRLLPQFSSLPASTQRVLLSQNLPLVKRLRQAVCLASSLPLSALFGFINEASLPQGLLDIRTTYRGLWKSESEALGLLEDVANWLELGDVTQLLLLLLLLLFCPDNIGVEERPMAERVQLKYVLLLQVSFYFAKVLTFLTFKVNRKYLCLSLILCKVCIIKKSMMVHSSFSPITI